MKLFQKAVGNYLRPWGLSPQKPAQRSREQSPEAVKYWME
ncbi:MAG: IS630 family transposase, partial [Cyanobacteria bacterium SW_11_48_12]